MTTDAQFVAFAANLGCDVQAEKPLAQLSDDCQAALLDRGYLVWSIKDALDLITTTPEADVARQLIACLERWFFIQKIVV